MKRKNIDIYHYDKKKNKIDIQSSENCEKIKRIVTETINKKIGL